MSSSPKIFEIPADGVYMTYTYLGNENAALGLLADAAIIE